MTGRRTGSNKAIKFSNFSDEELRKFVGNLDAVMFDCDGVIWLENQPMLNASALIKKLRSLGKKIFFITNNSTRTREEFILKFNALGFEVDVDEIIGPSYLAALYLKEKNFQKKAYVVGNKGITQELAKVGIESLPIGVNVDILIQLHRTSGCKPIVMGKPEPLAFEYISKRHQLDPARVLMIGDSCKSDILFGRRCGVWTFLVMSGCTKEEEIHRWEESADAEENLYVPDYYLDDVNELYTRISTDM